MEKLDESRDDAGLNDPLNLLVGSISNVAERPTSITEEREQNTCRPVRTVDAFSLVFVLIIDYFTFVCNLLLSLP